MEIGEDLKSFITILFAALITIFIIYILYKD